jgi:hypothetical protein
MQDTPKYLTGARNLVLGHNFLTFALQFTGADVSFPRKFQQEWEER